MRRGAQPSAGLAGQRPDARARARAPRTDRGDDALRFDLRVEQRRYQLMLARPVRVGPATIEALTLDLGVVAAPVALRGSLDGLRTRRSAATSYRIALDLAALPELARARGLTLGVVGVAPPARVRLHLADRLGPLGVDLDVVAAGASPALALSGVRAPQGGPATSVGRALGLLRAAGVALDPDSGLLRVPDPARLVLREALAGRGFRVPATDGPIAPPRLVGDALWFATVDADGTADATPARDTAWAAADAGRARALRGAPVLAALEAGDLGAAVAALGTHVPGWLRATVAVEADLPQAAEWLSLLDPDAEDAAVAALLALRLATRRGDGDLAARAARMVARAEPARQLAAASLLDAARGFARDPALARALFVDAVSLGWDEPAVVAGAVEGADRLGPDALVAVLARCAEIAGSEAAGLPGLSRLLLARLETPARARLAWPLVAAARASGPRARDARWEALSLLASFSRDSAEGAPGAAETGLAPGGPPAPALDDVVERLVESGERAAACALLTAAARALAAQSDAPSAAPPAGTVDTTGAAASDGAPGAPSPRRAPAPAAEGGSAERLALARARVAQALRIAADAEAAVDLDALDALAADLAARAGDAADAASHYEAIRARPAAPRRAPLLAAAARFHLGCAELDAARRFADAALRADPQSAAARAVDAEVGAREATARASSAGTLRALDAFALAEVVERAPEVAPLAASVVAALADAAVDGPRATALLAAARSALARPDVDEDDRAAALRALAGAAAAAAARLHDPADLLALEPFAPGAEARAELARRAAALLRGEGDPVGAARALARAGVVRRDLATLRAAIDLCERSGAHGEALAIVDRALLVVGDGPARPALLARADALRRALGASTAGEGASRGGAGAGEPVDPAVTVVPDGGPAPDVGPAGPVERA